jgi:hypothetical protein
MDEITIHKPKMVTVMMILNAEEHEGADCRNKRPTSNMLRQHSNTVNGTPKMIEICALNFSKTAVRMICVDANASTICLFTTKGLELEPTIREGGGGGQM